MTKANPEVHHEISERARWLWEYRLEEEEVLYARVNFFLVSHAMLFAAYAAMLAATRDATLLLRTTAVVGLVLGITWAYVSARQRNLIGYAISELRREHPFYKEHVDRRPTWPLSSSWLLVYVVPAALLVAWLGALWTAI